MLRIVVLLFIWLGGVIVFEPYLPFEWVLGGLLAFSWVLKPQAINLLALSMGILIDLYWGRGLGLTSLFLLAAGLISNLVHEQLAQWWVLGLLGFGLGLTGSFFFEGMPVWMTAVYAGLITILWRLITQQFLGKNQGVYLKRQV